MDYTPEQLDEKLKSLPKDLREAIASVEIGALVASIGDEEGLMLDQSADLMDEVGYVMLGLTPTSSFVRTLAEKLDIKESKASMIATKINEKIFNKIRSSLEAIQEKEQVQEAKKAEDDVIKLVPAPAPVPPAPAINNSSLEKVGDLVIEKRTPSDSPLYNSSNLKREDVLRDLEDIERLKPQNADSFVGHLLSNPVPVAKPPSPPVSAPKPPPPPPEMPQKLGADPYRERV